MANELAEDAPLTADEILTFGPVVEAQVWTPVWIAEARAPIAVNAGRPKLGPVFDERGIGKAVVIRPCMSRGRRVRGLPPIYTPQMLESNAQVFNGWPMFTDHVPAELAATIAKSGRSVKELGGQVLTGRWAKDYVHEDDGQYGYRKGGVLAEVWATPLVRGIVGENPNVLHTSINAWPTSGKPGPCPWRPETKGMVIEGIRRQPQGSVDYVVRGGAGGRLLLVSEGLEDEGAWPELGEWNDEDRAFVVSLAESFYASPAMTQINLPSKPDELRGWLAEHASHLLPALESASTQPELAAPAASAAPVSAATPLTEADVRRLLEEERQGVPSVEDFESHLEERAMELLHEREQQRHLADVAAELIESAEGILPRWKQDLKTRYKLTPDGAPSALLVEADGDKSAEDVLRERVTAELDQVRELLLEAQGKPRPKDLGGKSPDAAADRAGTRRERTPHWRTTFVEMGIAESEDAAVKLFGQVEG